MKSTRSMSDQEFDKMFQDKLFTLEVEPGEAVWEGVVEKLDTGSGRRSFPMLRLAAASLIAMIGFGIWLAKTNEPMKLSAVPVEDKAGKENVHAGTSKLLTEIKSTPTSVSARADAAQTKKTQVVTPASSRKIIPRNIPMARPSESIASKARPSTDEAALPEKVSLTRASDIPVAQKETPTLAVASEDALDESDSFQKKPLKIRTVGGLVNFVVSKVDKRQNKIIEFEEGDEGTVVSGVNLGLIKFKPKQ